MSGCNLSKETINETKARVVASFVCVLAYVGLESKIFLAFIFADFVVRVSKYKKYSPLGLLAEQVSKKLPKKIVNAGSNELATKIGAIASFLALLSRLSGNLMLSNLFCLALIFASGAYASIKYCAACDLKSLFDKYIKIKKD